MSTVSDPDYGLLYQQKLCKLLSELDKLKVSILVTGIGGCGKSTLVNSILGQGNLQAKEGWSFSRCTTEVKTYLARKGNVEVTIWDTPGLRVYQEEYYLQQMQQKCSTRDITLFCIKALPLQRFVRGPVVLAMKELTRTFGKDFWKTTIIVLTFTNIVYALHWEREDLSLREKFNREIQRWKCILPEILIKDIEVPEEIVKSVPMVPAGHYKLPDLPGCRFWFSNLWFHIVIKLTKEVRSGSSVSGFGGLLLFWVCYC